MHQEIPPSRELPIDPPVAVLSDLHLGHPASFLHDPAMVLPLLGNARTVVFNGDTFEQQHRARRDLGRRHLERLMELCLDRGARPLLLTGNHDPAASSAHYLDLYDGRVFLSHGDLLHEAVAPWSEDTPAIRAERARLLDGRSPPVDLDAVALLAKQAERVAGRYGRQAPPGIQGQAHMVAKFAVEPWRIVLALNYWARVSHYARAFTKRHRPSARLMVYGHSHRPGVWIRRDLTLVNTGCFQPLSRPLVVHIDGRRAVIHRTRFRRRAYQMAEELHQVPLVD